MKKPEISIIIAHYKTPELLAECLRSVQKHCDLNTTQVIVSDGETTRTMRGWMKSDFAFVELVGSRENIGYGGLIRKGLKKSRGEFIVYMNADIVLTKNSLQKMATYLSEHRDVGAVGPKLIGPNGKRQISRYRFYTAFAILARRTFWKKTKLGKKTLMQFEMRDIRSKHPYTVDWVQGSCIMTRRECFDRVGSYDPRFFMYFEDVDLCRRYWMEGLKIVYLPNISLKHLHRRESHTGLGILDVITNKLTRIHIYSAIKYFTKYIFDPVPNRKVEQVEDNTSDPLNALASKFSRLKRRESGIDEEPSVGIVILNFNGWRETIRLINNLESQSYRNYFVVVVDNASLNDSSAQLSKFVSEYTAAKVFSVYEERNSGYAGGNNVGIQLALSRGADYVCVLNPDVIVAPNFLEEVMTAAMSPESNLDLQTYIARGRKLGMWGARIFMAEEPQRIWYNGGWIQKNLLKAGPKDYGVHVRKIKDDAFQSTEYITGTAIVISRQCLQEVGLLKEDFFLYYEDVEWSINARSKNYELIIVNDAHVWHEGFHSTGQHSYGTIYYHERNQWYLAQRYGSAAVKLNAYINSVVQFIKQPIKYVVDRKNRFWVKPIMKAAVDFWMSRTGKISRHI